MALTVASPTSGTLQLGLRLQNVPPGQALVAIPLPSGVTVASVTDGALPILGAVVMGSIVDGVFVQQLPS